MRFSLVWLLAATGYAALVCASVLFIGDAWSALVGFLGSLILVGAATGVFLAHGPHRAFCVGFIVAALFARLAVYGSWKETADLRAATDLTAQAVSDALAAREVEKRPYVIRRGDKLNIFVGGIVKAGGNQESIGGQFALGPDGDVKIDPRFGAVSVAGMTLQEAEAALKVGTGKRYHSPNAQVTVLETANPFPSASRTDVVRQHLIFVFSFAGALLGLWFHRREEKAPD